MIRNLSFPQLLALLTTVFAPRPDERGLTIFMDLPGGRRNDHAAWMDRRRIAAEWYALLVQNFESVPFTSVNCCAYLNVGSNNGDLPKVVMLIDSDDGTHTPPSEGEIALLDILEKSSVVLAVTELSATAPLKILAKDMGFRGATMPGFSRNMIPALGLDYQKIDRRVMEIKGRMDRAQSATLILGAEGRDHRLDLDLRHTRGNASGGLIREPGHVANLPSGEAYIVPFEGEGAKNPSLTGGTLPVQFGDEVVVFQIEANRAVGVEGNGEEALFQKDRLSTEPAYGNIAELGIGVLAEWGVQPVDNTLLDEKLGLHIAFGRSDHFGGKTGPNAFRNPKNVVHIDWVYVPSAQPSITVKSLHFQYEDGGTEQIFRDGRLLI